MNRRAPEFTLVVFSYVLTIFAFFATARAEDSDWRQWRGPRRDGVVDGVRLPRDWLKNELRARWRVPVGEGYATPLVSGNRVYTFGRESSSEVIEAHELGSGKVVWRVAYPAKYEDKELKGPHGSGPRATPVLHNERLFTYGINEVLSCVDAQTGRHLWRVDFPRRFGTEPPGYGAASSPMIAGRHLIVPAGNRVFALDYHSGSVVWNVKVDSFYSSIIQADFAGTNQFVAFTRYRVLGLDPQDGKILWSTRYPSMFGSNIASPVVWKDRVVVSSSSQGTRAFRVRKRGSQWAAEPVWQTKSLRAYLTSPVVQGDHLYGLDEGGMLFCLDLESGRVAWSGGAFSDFGTMLVVGDQILILTGYGDLTAVEATPVGYRELGERPVAKSATWTPLAIAHGCLFVRDKSELTCFELEVTK